MVVELVRAYLEAASGLTELTRKHAVAVAKILIREGEERSTAPAREPRPPKTGWRVGKRHCSVPGWGPASKRLPPN